MRIGELLSEDSCVEPGDLWSKGSAICGVCNSLPDDNLVKEDESHVNRAILFCSFLDQSCTSEHEATEKHDNLYGN